MELMKHDSSGTEDDLPNHDIIRTSRPVLLSGAMRITSGPVSREKEMLDMNFQIHGLEREAYGAVMRAFFAQSEALTWSKESLMSDLRKELRLCDDEHREILATINSDESMKAIREWHAQKLTVTNATGFDPVARGHVARKKLKTGHSAVLSSPKYPSSTQPSPAVTMLVRNDQWGNPAPSFSPQLNVGQVTVPVLQNGQAGSTGKMRGPLGVQPSSRGFVHPGSGIFKPDIIEIRATDMLIHQVEKVCGGENPDPGQLQRAKLLLREQERALMEAIGKLADVTDGDVSPDPRWQLYEEPQRNAHGSRNAAQRKLDRTRGGYYTEGYVKDRPGTGGTTYIGLPDSEFGQGC